MTGRPLVVAMCVAHVLSLGGIGTFPSLLPIFFDTWGITNTEAGWISGIYFGGYALAVPVLASLTDHIDSRRVYLFSAALGGIALGGFALFADGFWTAGAFRALAGIALAGTYMPGLKILTDRVTGAEQSRLVAFYTSSFGIGSSLSIWLAGVMAGAFPWRWAFALAALGSVLAILVVVFTVKPHTVIRADGAVRWLDFRPVVRNRPAMGFVLAYGAHCWELLGFRSWLVAFLVFSASLQSGSEALWSATAAAAAINLLGVPSSIIGNELAVRFGRRRMAITVMLCSAAAALGIGFSASLPYFIVVILFAIYGILVTGESATITAGSVVNAFEGQRGSTMAMHSFVGFLTSFIGPIAFGAVLDGAGGNENWLAWGLAFAAMGAGVVLGPVALLALTPRDVPKPRAM
ncbi:MAG: MFS transporter [Alphaproteobacteria bacterium]